MSQPENKLTREEVQRMIEEKVSEIIKKRMNFTQKKIGDTPTDNYMFTPRGYVNMYGSIAGAPVGSVVGQQYFATDLGYPVFKNSNSRWSNSVGSVVG